nr:immunoglobulin heavy chain junction region [Mus musculus]
RTLLSISVQEGMM